MLREDLSDRLVHLTKGTHEEASRTLHTILREGRLLGGTTDIRGAHPCVCFSEAPIAKLSMILASQTPQGFRYMPYGIMVGKKWLFDRGGRPVIYQPNEDYQLLPEALRYRHVRFEPPQTDHTWEREWRIQVDELPLDSDAVTVVVPDRATVEAMRSEHEGRVVRRAMSGEVGRVEHPDWHFIALEDLGVSIPR